jgi:hypothetical protein
MGWDGDPNSTALPDPAEWCDRPIEHMAGSVGGGGVGISSIRVTNIVVAPAQGGMIEITLTFVYTGELGGVLGVRTWHDLGGGSVTAPVTPTPLGEGVAKVAVSVSASERQAFFRIEAEE